MLHGPAHPHGPATAQQPQNLNPGYSQQGQPQDQQQWGQQQGQQWGQPQQGQQWNPQQGQQWGPQQGQQWGGQQQWGPQGGQIPPGQQWGGPQQQQWGPQGGQQWGPHGQGHHGGHGPQQWGPQPGQGQQWGQPGQQWGQPGNAQWGQQGYGVQVMEGQNIYITANSNPKMCIDVTGSSKNDSAEVILFDYNGTANQIWIRQGNCLVSKCSGKAMDISGGEKEGSKVIQFGKHGQANQQWQILPVQNNPNLAYIVSPSGLALTVKGNNMRAKTQIVASKYNGSPNQHWIINHC